MKRKLRRWLRLCFALTAKQRTRVRRSEAQKSRKRKPKAAAL
jgi:hypothetical protein